MIIDEGDGLVNDENYRVTLRSYHDKLKTEVKIECTDYNTFKKVIDVVNPILEEEEKSKIPKGI